MQTAILALKSAGNPSVNGSRPKVNFPKHRLFCKVDCGEWSTCRIVDLHNINIQNLTIGVRSNVSWYSRRSGSWPCTSWPNKVRPFFIDSVNRALLQLHTIDLFWHWSRQSPFAWNRSLGSSNYKLLAQQEIILVKSYIRLATMWGWMQSCHL